jgi:hypothetical protein
LPAYDPDPETILAPRVRTRPAAPNVVLTEQVEAFLAKRSEIPIEISEYQAKLDALNRHTLERPERVKMALGESSLMRPRGKLAEEILSKGISAATPLPVKNFLPKGVEFSKRALVAEVEEFLARRKSASEALNEEAPALTANLPAWARSTVEPTRPTGAISPNDILAQLFFDKSISAWQASAGRRWQRAMQDATLQPSACVEWSEPVSRSFHYQPRGEVSESQWSAMKFRASVGRYAGMFLVRALDYCLDFDVGVSGLRAKLKKSNRQVAALVGDMLTKLCECIAALEERSAPAQATFWRSDNGKPTAHKTTNGVHLLRPSKILPAKEQIGFQVRQRDMRAHVLRDDGNVAPASQEAAGVV